MVPMSGWVQHAWRTCKLQRHLFGTKGTQIVKALLKLQTCISTILAPRQCLAMPASSMRCGAGNRDNFGRLRLRSLVCWLRLRLRFRVKCPGGSGYDSDPGQNVPVTTATAAPHSYFVLPMYIGTGTMSQSDGEVIVKQS